MPTASGSDVERILQTIRSYTPQQTQQSSGQRVQTGAVAGDGTGLPAEFTDLYRTVAAKQAQKEQDERDKENNEKMQATPLDVAAKNAFTAAQGLYNMGGAQDYFQKQVEAGGFTKDPIQGAKTFLGLAAMLPGGMAGGPIEGIGQLYEGATARDAQSVDEDGMMSAKKLTPEQQAWSLVNAGINLGGLPVGATARAGGVIGKGVAKGLMKTGNETAEKVAKNIEKFMPNEGKGMVSKGLEDSGFGKAAQVVGQTAFDAAEEGVEEFVQTFAEHGREGDEFTSDTWNEAFSSAGYGALGGAMMSAGSQGINSAMGSLKTVQEKAMKKLDQSGPKRLGEIKDKVSSREFVPTAKTAFDETVKKQTESNGAFGLTQSPNPRNIGLDEGHIGIDGFRAQWKAADDEGRQNLMELVQYDAETIDSILDDTSMNEIEKCNLLAKNLRGKHENHNLRAIKREPGLSNTTVHGIWITDIVPGARLELHPMTTQLGNGDIDGDVKTILRLIDHNVLMPSQIFLNPDGRSTDFALEFLPDLDVDYITDDRGKKIDIVHNVLEKELRYNLQSLRPMMDDRAFDGLIDAVIASARKAKSDYKGEGGRRFIEEMNRLAQLTSERSGNDALVQRQMVSSVVGGVMKSMYNTLIDEQVFDAIVTRDLNVTEAKVREAVEVEMAAPRARRISSGSTGNAKTMAAIVDDLGWITSLLIGTQTGAIFRNGQAIKYGIAKKVQKFAYLDAAIFDNGTDNIEYTLANMMKLVNLGEHMNENITSLFNTLVLVRFMKESKLSESTRLGGHLSLDASEFLDTYMEVRNELAKQFNKAVKKEFHTGLQAIIGSVEKLELHKDSDADRETAAGMLMDTLRYFPVSDILDLPASSPENNMYFGDMITMMAHDELRSPVLNYVGGKNAKLLQLMINHERKSYDRAYDGIMADNRKLPRFTAEDLSNPNNYGRASLVLEAIVHILDPIVCIEQNIAEVYSAAESEYGWSIFSGRPEDIANVQLTASVRTAYKYVMETYERYEQATDENVKNSLLREAITQASALRGESALSKSIYAELREDGTIKQLRFLTDMGKTFDDKVDFFKGAAQEHGVMFENLLISALSLTQPNLDTITSRVRENKKTISEVSEEAMTNARNEGNALITFMRELATSEEQKTIMERFKDYCMKDAYILNDELWVGVIADSTNIHLRDDEKGTTIDSAMMFYQQMEMLHYGGPTSLATKMQELTANKLSVKEFLSNKKAWMDILFNGGEIYLHSPSGADSKPINLDVIMNEVTGHSATGEDGTLSVNDLAELIEECPQLVRLLEPHSITPSMNKDEEGGTGQTGTERASGNLANRFETYLTNCHNGVENVIRNQEKAALEKALLNDKRFPIIFASFLDINEDGTVDRNEILKKKRMLVDEIYEILGRYEDGDNIVVEDYIIEMASQRIGEAIFGDSGTYKTEFSDLAKKIANGGVSSIFSQTFIENMIKKTMEEELENNPIIRETGFTFDKALSFLQTLSGNFDEALKIDLGVNTHIEEINGASFAMLGQDRVKRILRQNIKSTLKYDDMPQVWQQQLDDMIENSVDTICNRLVDNEKYVVAEDLMLDDAAITRKFEDILTEPAYGASPETRNNMLDNLRKVLGESGDKRARDLEELRVGINNVILSNAIRSVSSYTNASVNEFFVEDAFTIARSFGDMISDLRSKELGLEITQHRQYQENREINLPKINIHDPKNAFVALMAGRHVSEGQIGIKTGVEGFVLKEAYGLSLIPHLMSCNAEPEESSISDFNFMEHLGQFVIIEDGKKRRSTILSTAFNPRDFSKDAVVYYYDPDKCTSPMACRHHFGGTLNPFTKSYLSTTSAFFELCAWAQEQANLKLKKTLVLTGNVINVDSFDPLITEDVNVAQMDVEAMRKAARKCSNNLKKELEDRYTQVLKSASALDKDNIDDSDIDPSIPETVASVNSSVLVLTGVNGEESYASLYELNDDTILAEITEKLGGKIISMRSYPISFEQINSKIENNVLNGLKGKDSYQKSDIDQLAWEAVTEWRNYGTKSESVGYLMSMLSLYQVSGPTNVIPAGHLTAEQLFRNYTNPDGTIKKPFKKRPASVNYQDDDRVVKDNLEFQKQITDTSGYTGNYVSNNLDYFITNVKEASDYKIYMDTPENREIFNKGRNLNYQDKFYGQMPSATLMLDRSITESMIRQWIEEGYEGYEYIIVPETVTIKNAAAKLGFGYKKRIMWGETFAEINISEIHKEIQSQDGLTYGEGSFNIDQVCLFMYDYMNLYHQGDGGTILNDKAADKVAVNDYRDLKVSIDALPSTNFMCEVVPRDELVSVCQSILNNDVHVYYPKIKRINDAESRSDLQNPSPRIEDDARKWFEKIANGEINMSMFHEDGYLKGNIARNTPFAIISRVDADGNVYYMPAYATGDILENTSEITGFSWSGGNKGEFRFHTHTKLKFTDDVNLKGTQSNEASKTELRRHNKDDIPMPETPGLKIENKAVVNQNTRKSRIIGTSEKLLKESLFILGKLKHSHFAFSLSENGHVEINPNLNYDPSGKNPTALNAKEIDRLMGNYNNKQLLKDIANGRKRIFKDNPDLPMNPANVVVARMASECLAGNGITFSNLLCPFECTVSFSDFIENKNNAKNDAKLVCNRVAPREIVGVFRKFSFVDMSVFYNHLNSEIIPDPFFEKNGIGPQRQTIMDSNGDILLTVNGRTAYYPARFSFLAMMENDTRIGERQVNSSWSMQQRVGWALRNGVAPSDLKSIIDAIRVKHADSAGYSERIRKESNSVAHAVMSDYNPNQNLLNTSWMKSWGRDVYTEQVNAQRYTFDRNNLKIREGDNTLSNPMDSDKFKNAYKSFVEALGGDYLHTSVDFFMNIIKIMHGWSYSDGDGDMTISVGDVTIYTNEFINTLKSDAQYLIEGKARGTGDRARISFGLLPRNVAQELWYLSEDVRNKFGSLSNFRDSMLEQQENSVACIATYTTTGKGGEAAARITKKRDALWFLHAFLCRTWNIAVPNGAAMSNMVEQDWIDSLRMVKTGLYDDISPEEVEKIIEGKKEARRQAVDASVRIRRRKLIEVNVPGAVGEKVTVSKAKRKKNPLQKVLDGTVDIMQFMAMLDPAILMGNVGEGTFRGWLQDLATMLPGTFVPWGKDKRTFSGTYTIEKNGETIVQNKQNVIHALAHNQELQQLLKMMRETSLHGDLEAFVMGVSADGETVESMAEKLYGNDRKWAKIRDRVFGTMSGDTLFITGQTRRMLKFLDTYITQGDYPELMVKDSDGVTYFERMLTQDPAKFIISLLGTDSRARTEVLRAVNTSDTYSMAQRNVVSIIAEHLLSQSSVANALSAFILTPFLRYNTNIMGRSLNWWLPMSSLNYVVVNQLSQFNTFKDMGIEQAQVYDSLKSALIMDAAHMAFPVVGAILLALGAIDYPDDEDKRGNYGEYLFFGKRISEDYVLSDLTGPILPYACFMKNVLDGVPRIDVLFNGVAEVSSKNPLMKVGEIIDIILSPDQMMEDMEDEAAAYDDTVGGVPDPTKILAGKTEATLLTMAGKVFTPGILKSLGKTYKYEASYKRIWEPNTGDVDVSAGILAPTVKVDYDEAIVRKVTRDNPILGVIANVLHGADTSYTATTTLGAKREMTPVLYPEQTQRFIRNKYSIYATDEYGEYVQDDKGNFTEKSDQEKEAIALDIIATLQSYEDMEELYSNGFIMDSGTRKYVGDIIWQTVGQLQTEFWTWYNSTDNYELGGGDFTAGASIKQDARNQMDKAVDYWTNFYYKKLNSEPMKRGLQYYLRENVQYVQDDNGEWYASGFNRGMNPINYILGVKLAPGTMEDDQGTMGYEGDWETPSAVIDGQSTGQRSLVALPQDTEETVPFEDLAENHPELAEAIEKAKNGSYGSSSKGSGYKTGYSGGGGGGGGGGASIYSHPSGVNVPTSRTISTSRPYDSRFDYLRPGFETKGSREASRRSDF